MTRKRKTWTAQEKAVIIREHLVENVPVSDLCDRHGLHPTLFCALDLRYRSDPTISWRHIALRADHDSGRWQVDETGGSFLWPSQ